MTFPAHEQEGAHSLEITGIYGLTSKVTRPDEGMGGVSPKFGLTSKVTRPDGGYPQNLWFFCRVGGEGGIPKIYSPDVRRLRGWGYAQNL